MVTCHYWYNDDPNLAIGPISCCAAVFFKPAPRIDRVKQLQKNRKYFFRQWTREDRLESVLEPLVQDGSLVYEHKFLMPEDLVGDRAGTLVRTMELLVSKVQYKASCYCPEVRIEGQMPQYLKSGLLHHYRQDLKSFEGRATRVIALMKRQWIIDNHWNVLFPQYRWEYNRGFLTIDHIDTILREGLTRLHYPDTVDKIVPLWVEAVRSGHLDTLLNEEVQLDFCKGVGGYWRRHIDTEQVRKPWWFKKMTGVRFRSRVDPEAAKDLDRIYGLYRVPEFHEFWIQQRHPLHDDGAYPPIEQTQYKKESWNPLEDIKLTLHQNVQYPEDKMPKPYRERFEQIYRERREKSVLAKLLAIDKIATHEMERELKVIPNTDQSWFFFLSKLLLHQYYRLIPKLKGSLESSGCLYGLALHHAFRRKRAVILNGRYQDTAHQTLQYIELKRQVWRSIDALLLCD